MQHVPALPLIYEFSRHVEPRVRIAPGETITVESEDALSGQIRKMGDRRDKSLVPYSNPLAGPIYVEGAQPGDALSIRIESIKPRDGQCATYTANPRQLCEWLGSDVPHGAHVCPIRDGVIQFSDSVTIDFQPMLGCIGVATDWGVPSTWPAGPHGGNMDIIEVCPGSTIFLPVFVPGGYLYLGDAHAAMGHGELSATGLEMAAISTVTIGLVHEAKLACPRIKSANEIMTVVSGTPMERSIAEAYARLILWMEQEYGWNRWAAYDLLTHVGQVSVGFYALGTVAAKVAIRYVETQHASLSRSD